jgi:hypothetical protein
MAGQIVLTASSSGTVTLVPADTGNAFVVTLPAETGNIITTGTATRIIPKAAVPVGSVLQVVSTNYTTVFSTTSVTPVNVTGFSATITPTSTSSKILVMVSVCFGGANDIYPYILVNRNGTSIGTGTTATGNRINTFLSGAFTAIASMQYRNHQFSKDFLDSPSSIAALTYQVQLANPYQVVSATGYINRAESNVDTVYVQFPSSSITLMEIAA